MVQVLSISVLVTFVLFKETFIFVIFSFKQFCRLGINAIRLISLNISKYSLTWNQAGFLVNLDVSGTFVSFSRAKSLNYIMR